MYQQWFHVSINFLNFFKFRNFSNFLSAKQKKSMGEHINYVVDFFDSVIEISGMFDIFLKNLTSLTYLFVIFPFRSNN